MAARSLPPKSASAEDSASTGDHVAGAFGDASELDGALREEVGEALEMTGDRVKQLVERDELWALHVPMGVLGLIEQVDRIG